jgi:opacity protein-like surface antigen
MRRKIIGLLLAILMLALLVQPATAFKAGQFQVGGGLYLGLYKFSKYVDADLPVAPGAELIAKALWTGNPLKHLFGLRAELGLGLTKTKQNAKVESFIENTYIPLHLTIYASILPKAKVHPYLGIGAGLLAWNIKTDESVLYQTHLNLTMHFALGADYNVARHLLLDLGFKFHYILGDLRQFDPQNLKPILHRNGWYFQFGLGATVF